MTKAVLVQRSTSIYDDEAGDRYHFPRQYLKRLQECSGDWVIFYSPVKDMGVSREARGAYFATARLGEISADPENADLYYVAVDPATYADFSAPVPRQVAGKFLEPRMSSGDGTLNAGVALQAVRPISEQTFESIIKLAWKDAELELPRTDDQSHHGDQVYEPASDFQHEVERETTLQLSNRKVRDPRFRAAVLNAYGKRCAITGWSFTNGGGRAEVEAAHIRPVQFGGPDRICNGLALSGTVHWMFDRGLIGVSADDDIIISRKVNDPESITRLINPTRKLVRPDSPQHQPHPAYLEWHRHHHQLAA